jgi:hypothetical protein
MANATPVAAAAPVPAEGEQLIRKGAVQAVVTKGCFGPP